MTSKRNNKTTTTTTTTTSVSEDIANQLEGNIECE
jgi:hypothetical protein